MLRGSLLDLAVHKTRPLWSASSPVIALRLRDRQLGVTDQTLGLTLLDVVRSTRSYTGSADRRAA